MNTTVTKKYSLIDGTFNVADAKEVLLALIDNKIRYHQQRIFSHEERFGKPCQFSEERIIQLRQTRSEIVELLKQYEEQGKDLQIHSDIQIDIK